MPSFSVKAQDTPGPNSQHKGDLPQRRQRQEVEDEGEGQERQGCSSWCVYGGGGIDSRHFYKGVNGILGVRMRP